MSSNPPRDETWPSPPREKFKKAAYCDGWAVCGAGGLRHDRPAYLTHGEREAFNQGWEDRAERIAYGYDDHPQQEAAKASSNAS